METHWTDGIELKVIEGYKAKGIKATGVAYAPLLPTEPCCALGALRLEDETLVQTAKGHGCPDSGQAWAFALGFDYAMMDRDPNTSSYSGQVSFVAGVRTAEAVMAAGLRDFEG